MSMQELQAPRPGRGMRVVGSAILAVAWFTLPLGISIILFAYLGEVSDWLRGHGPAASR